VLVRGFWIQCARRSPARPDPLQVFDAGLVSYANHGVCSPARSATVGTPCLCNSKADCPFFPHSSCVPFRNLNGTLSGPYTCTGCLGSCPGFSDCPNCATDHEGNRFCSSSPCDSDADCGNPGVACCDATCDAGACCGNLRPLMAAAEKPYIWAFARAEAARAWSRPGLFPGPQRTRDRLA